MKTLTVAVVGAGYWGPNLVRNFLRLPAVKIASVCDLDKKKLNALKSTYPFISTTTNYHDLLYNSSLDLIAIATPVATHFELAQKALLWGKHVMLEKPLTKSSAEAVKLLKLSRKKNRQLMVGFTFVYTGAVRKIKSLIDHGELGEVYYYDSTRINLGLLQSDTNVIWDLAPHDLSILNYIHQFKPASLQAFGSSHINSKNLEMAHLIIKYQNNSTAHINVSWLSPVKIRKILIGGSKKMIVYDDIEPSEKLKIYDKSVSLKLDTVTPFSPAYRSGNVIIPHLDQTEALFTELSHFVDCIRKNTKPLTDGAMGLKVVTLLEAADRAIAQRKEIYL